MSVLKSHGDTGVFTTRRRARIRQRCWPTRREGCCEDRGSCILIWHRGRSPRAGRYAKFIICLLLLGLVHVDVAECKAKGNCCSIHTCFRFSNMRDFYLCKMSLHLIAYIHSLRRGFSCIGGATTRKMLATKTTADVVFPSALAGTASPLSRLTFLPSPRHNTLSTARTTTGTTSREIANGPLARSSFATVARPSAKDLTSMAILVYLELFAEPFLPNPYEARPFCLRRF